MPITKESLEAQLKSLEAESELAKGNFYRTDGAIQLIKHLLEECDKPEVTVKDA